MWAGVNTSTLSWNACGGSPVGGYPAGGAGTVFWSVGDGSSSSTVRSLYVSSCGMAAQAVLFDGGRQSYIFDVVSLTTSAQLRVLRPSSLPSDRAPS